MFMRGGSATGSTEEGEHQMRVLLWMGHYNDGSVTEINIYLAKQLRNRKF